MEYTKLNFNSYNSSLSFIWIGILIGISLLATPVKFMVENLAYNTALQVDSLTFYYSHWAQAVLAILMMFSWANKERIIPVIRVQSVLMAFLYVQMFILLPELVAQIPKIISPGDSQGNLHTIYIILEVLKLGMLIITPILIKRYSDNKAALVS